MKPTTEKVLATLKGELAFLEGGGYRTMVGERQPLFVMETAPSWRPPLFFEDSPSCPKKRYCPCDPDGDCALLSLVPAEHRHDNIPCRHIPLNEAGETMAGLYRTADSNKAIAATLRSWLVKTITSLEESPAA